jgi:cyclic beta-1,2-glucan synthetase
MLNPVEHARDPQQVEEYKVEPYVVAADVYALENQVGRGGWTWYTGSASWMYRAWIEEVLGFHKRDNRLFIEPSIPTDWSGFTLRYRFESTLYHIEVQNPDGVERGVRSLEMDGKRLRSKFIPLLDDGVEHRVVVRLGTARQIADDSAAENHDTVMARNVNSETSPESNEKLE